MDKNELKEIIKKLDDLCYRLQKDYAGDKSFEQAEEDRLVVYNAIEILENLIKKYKKN